MSEAPHAPRNRYESIEIHLPEIEKFIAGLEAVVFEPYETLGMALMAVRLSAKLPDPQIRAYPQPAMEAGYRLRLVCTWLPIGTARVRSAEVGV
jgi:hypothetical protein